ncbi:MAG: DEAD/DEAH box helicase [Candidatus Bipolaricaulis sp.]|nr:DEAD/DEAH box helicase [Candidatus Bipolaricaulis sp.]MDD5219178.1 DEAD/DEAH box helicase [Candidatus Bipolaricaulis sp.]
MHLDEFLSDLARDRSYRGQVVYATTLPAHAPEYGAMALRPEIERFLNRQGIRLYRHQIETIAALRAGRDVVLTTPTASGKTLAFHVPTAEWLSEDPKATALYLYPLKALANDQLEKLNVLDEACGADLRPSTYDGDTPQQKRAWIRRSARVVLTNPHALHQYLPWHPQWARILANLKLVVLDEAHHYRGVVGGNVAGLLSRLSRILEHYGAAPRFVVSSASIANPTEFASALTGREVVSIHEDASARGPRSVVFWDPMADPSSSITHQAASLLSFLTDRGMQAICFARSRVMAERVASAARRTSSTKAIQAYRAGYLAGDRREIETELREGHLRGVVSTSALESGIDVGGLDAAILVGFPGSLLSAWQQAGRAGRGARPSLVIYIPYEDPLDRYFLRDPNRFLSYAGDRLVLPHRTLRQRAGHLACAAAELPLRAEEIDTPDAQAADALRQSRLLADTPSGSIYCGLRRAHEAFPLEEMTGETVRLMCDGRTIETMNPVRARRDAYPGAVLLHRGETFVVRSLDLALGTAVATREEVDYSTQGLRTSAVEILSTEAAKRSGLASVSHGRVRVTESFIGYRAIHDDRSVSLHPLVLPSHIYETDGVWAAFPDLPSELTTVDRFGALHGAEHALIAMAPLLVLCDAADIAGASTPLHPQTGAATILLFDAIEDGAGLAEVLFEEWPRLARAAHDMVLRCPCGDGCPGCLLSPHCGSQNQPLSKPGAMRILAWAAAERKENG